MSQTFTILGIVGFSIALLLVLIAVIMYFGLHIKQVRDDLTGKTAARSIAEIRSRAKTRKRASTQAAKRYGWEKESISTDDLKAAAAGTSVRAAGDTGPVDAGSEYDENEISTTMLVEEGEASTTLLVEDDDEASTTLLNSSNDEEDESPTTNLANEAEKKSAGVSIVQSVQVFVLGLALITSALPMIAWANDDQKEATESAPKAVVAAIAETSVAPLALSDDVTDPELDAISWVQLEGDGTLQETQAADPSIPLDAEYRLHTKKLRLEVQAHDVDSGGSGDVISGIERVTLSINGSAEADFTYSDNGIEQKYLYDFDAAGVYDYSQFTITVYDQAGNTQVTDLSALTSQQEAEYLPAYKDFRINPDDPQLSVQVYAGGDLLGSAPYTSPAYTTANMCTIRVELTDEDMLLAKTDSTGMDQNKFDSWNKIVTIHSSGGDIELGLSDFVQVNGSTSTLYRAEYQVTDEDTYSMSASYSNLCNASSINVGDNLVFTIDRSKPYLTSAVWSSVGVPGTVVTDVFFSQKACLTVDMSDIKLDVSNNPVNCGVAGIGGATIQCLDANGAPYSPSIERVNNTFKFYFEADAQISFSTIIITIVDSAGNSTVVNLQDFYNALPTGEAPEYQHVAIGITPPEAGFTYNDHNLKNGIYLNRNAEGKVVINDRYFSYALDQYNAMTVQEQAAVGPILKVWYRSTTDATRVLEESLSLGILDFSITSNSSVWESDFVLSQDGYYDLELVYQNILGVSYSASANTFSYAQICIDTKKPEFGAAKVTPVSPEAWNTIFAPSGSNLNFSLSDSLSGIDPQELSVSIKGVVQPSSYDETTGILSVDIPADDRRIKFSDVQVRIMDKAGNVPKSLNLQDHENKNIDAQTTQLVVDAAAPVLSVTYDNNEVQNGQYYAAGRTATVTIIEASFDIVKKEDPYRVIATKTLGTSETALYAKAFKNPSGDGVTWVAQISCTTDGTYTIHAAFTDPAQKNAQSFDDSFVVDTRAPLILISFDNNDSENGGYFKAPRTATIRVYEDNFSETLALVSTQAADAGGNVVGAPGASGWQQNKAGEWECSVYFGQELHYALQVACTDLAGNVGEQAEEPEFVIDTTAPTVNVERVAHYTAYADTIAPLVSFEDTNFEAFLCNVEITGANAEGYRYFMNNDTPGETSRVIDYEDFPYELEYDDVYTLHATIKDRAGNAAEQTVVFSVNRFGSNYTFSEQTKPHVGSYLKKAEDIVIIETNVSGLESSAVRMAQNDRARALSAETDYQLEASDPQTSWSQYTYALPAKLFESDAFYRVMLSSQDVAGNYSENLMFGKNETRDGTFEVNFVVDGTNPVASLSNIEEGTAYYGPSQRLDVFMSDNIEAEQAFLVVNGVRSAEWSAEDLSGNRAFSYDLPASEDTYDVTIEMRDKAGNSTTSSAKNIVVTSDWIRYVLSTPAILYPMIAGTILVLGLAGIVIARMSLKKRNESKAA